MASDDSLKEDYSVNTAGVFSFALGGAFLLFSLFAIMTATLTTYNSIGPLFYGIIFGFLAFLLIGMGLSLIIETSNASKKND